MLLLKKVNANEDTVEEGCWKMIFDDALAEVCLPIKIKWFDKCRRRKLQNFFLFSARSLISMHSRSGTVGAIHVFCRSPPHTAILFFNKTARIFLYFHLSAKREEWLCRLRFFLIFT